MARNLLDAVEGTYLVPQPHSLLKMPLRSIVILYSLFSCLHGQDVEEHPSSLLIPGNKTAVFSCKAHCHSKQGCLVFWVINGNDTETKEKCSSFKQKGFAFSTEKEVVNGTFNYNMTLTINATRANNNTNMHCVFEETGDDGGSAHSETATLLVVTDSPISNNPSIEKNSTHLSLLWSPPFLWPGQRIQYYNISLVNKTDGIVAYYRVNSTFSDQLVTFVYQNEKCTSTEIEFRISAVGVSGLLVPVFNDTEWILPSDIYCCKEADTSSPSTTSDHETLSYKVAFGLSLSAATILLLVILILFACVMRLCPCFFNRITCSENGTKAKAYSNMVHNPIYAGLSGGPMYDSIWPLVETVGKSYKSTRLSTDGFRTAADNTALQERAASGEYQPSKAGYSQSRLW